MNTYTIYLTDKTSVIIKAKSPEAAKTTALKKTGLHAIHVRNYGP